MDTNTQEMAMALTDVKHYAITFDADGNEIRTEVEAPVLGDVQEGEGPVATEFVTH
jgi:hypothetical protein